MLEPTPAGPTAPPVPEEGASDLREYLAVLRARKWSIAFITLVTVAAALFFSFRQTPIYESEAQVLVNPVPVAGFGSAPPAEPNLDTERTVAASREVAELAAQRLEDARDPAALLESLSVEVATNSEVLIFRFADPKPLEAQRRAQAFALAYLDFRREKALESVVQVQESIQQQIDQISSELRRVNQRILATEDEVEQANLQTRTSQLAAQLAVLEQQRSQAASVGQLRVGDVIAQADLPSSPASPNHVLNGGLAFLVGLALGVGLAFLRERLDDRLRGQGDLEARAGAPVLAVVPQVPGWKKKNETPLITLTDPRSGPAEAYRTLRTSLLFAAAERGVRTILVTSPHPGEGKTATAANLAVVLSQAGRRVIALSADLRKPRLHRFFGADNKRGLSRLLTGEDSFGEAVRDVGLDGLRLVPSGPVPANPAELVGSHAMGKALERFGEVADLVVIDGPPILDVADAITLSPFADAVVLVADAEKTSRSALSHARKQLEQVKAEVIGAVLNNLDPTKARTYPYYYRYYYRYGYRYTYGAEEPDGLGRRGRGAGPEPEAVVAPPPASTEADVWQGSPLVQPPPAQAPPRAPSPPPQPRPAPTTPEERASPPAPARTEERASPPAPARPEERVSPPAPAPPEERVSPPAPAPPEERVSPPAPAPPEERVSPPAPAPPEERVSPPAPARPDERVPLPVPAQPPPRESSMEPTSPGKEDPGDGPSPDEDIYEDMLRAISFDDAEDAGAPPERGGSVAPAPAPTAADAWQGSPLVPPPPAQAPPRPPSPPPQPRPAPTTPEERASPPFPVQPPPRESSMEPTSPGKEDPGDGPSPDEDMLRAISFDDAEDAGAPPEREGSQGGFFRHPSDERGEPDTPEPERPGGGDPPTHNGSP